jgi:hypothetical protein
MQAPQRLDAIPAAELNKRAVVGMIGIPLGRVAEVECVIVGRREHLKDESDYLLKVVAVDGARLTQPPSLHFEVPTWARVELASDPIALHRLRKGKEASSLSDEQMRELEAGYVGRTVRLAAYETGGFTGLPRNWPKGAPSVQGRGFSFTTSLVLLAERQ